MVLIAVILFGWPYLTERFFPQPQAPVTASSSASGAPVASSSPAAVPTATAPIRPVSVAQAVATGGRIPIETPTLKGSINLTGARIDDLELVRYRETLAKDSPPVRLFAPGGTSKAYFATLGWAGAGLVAPTAATVWTAPVGAKLTPTTPVTLTWDNGQGQQFAITLSVDDTYMFTAKQVMTNRGTAPVAASAFSSLTRIGTSPDPDSWTIHNGAMGVFNDTAEYINKDDIDEAPQGTIAKRTTGGWLGFTDHFWLGAVIPAQNAAVDASIRHGDNNLYQADFATSDKIIAPNSSSTTESRIFAGAKETRVLDGYADNQGVTLLDRATDWGWFIWFAKPIFYLLDWLFAHIGNFGVAIMALTLIIRLVMYPIAQKQFQSMAAMRVVQPKVKALQEKYADDKPRMQQEMMALYKTEKINPLAGCLPILIQIPIFYALYKSLMLTVEMRHQPFALWIKDLSAPDPLHFLNLFGLLPFTPPAFLGIGVLAVLLGITMYLQFKLNPPPTDPIQAQVFSIMPWMMMFIMAPFAAGLLLYWITNNVLSIGQQRLLYARYPEMKEAMAAK
jgi:YidC/Oxa1 family membrane protein insertase